MKNRNSLVRDHDSYQKGRWLVRNDSLRNLIF
jgi:hypothetical protein